MVLSKLPNLSQKFTELKLILDLRTRANPHTILGQAIRNAIDGRNTPNGEILAYVKDQATDSPKTMSDCIGQELTERILNYQKL